MSKTYPTYKGLNLPNVAEEILARWKAENIFQKSIDTREGNTSVDDSGMPELVHWWKENVGNEEEADYTSKVVERFEKDEELKLIIVVSKLLTGFDEPKNAVLYIDKPLKDHNLIQAIARVNRLHEDKRFGLLNTYGD